MKLNSAQIRRLDAYTRALQQEGLSEHTARIKAEGRLNKRIKQNKSRADFRRQRQQAEADYGYEKLAKGWV